MDKKIVTRIPPSPTGNLHLGTARTALFNYLYAKKHGGKVVLRFEDTDTERSKPEFEKNIITGLAWLGIEYDEQYKQSERTSNYKKYLQDLLEDNHCYVSEEKATEPGQRSSVIRFKNPNKVITFQDTLRGDVTFDTTELGDFVVAKSLEEPLYHLAVVVDDFEMGITDIIRGEDGISNTPRQILIQEAIGAPRPIYTHIPFILGEDGKKLSKRHGATNVMDFADLGYLPEAINNHLAMLGWNPGTEQEFFNTEELLEAFSLDGVQKGAAVFRYEKLDWFNRHYLLLKSDDEKNNMIKSVLDELQIEMSGETLHKLQPLIFERIHKKSDIIDQFNEGEWDYVLKTPEIDVAKLQWKDAPVTETVEHFEYVISILEKLEQDASAEMIKDSIWDYATEKGRGNVLAPLRHVLTGKDQSPDPFTLIFLLGIDVAKERILAGISLLNK